MGIFDNGAATALNHLLRREAWAREKLAPFAGEVVELRFAPLPALRLAIVEGGQAVPADAGAATTLTISAKPGLLAALPKGEEHLMREIGRAHV